MKIIDMHCDTIKECFLRKENLRNNSLCVDLEKMKKNNGAAQFFAVWLSMPKNRTESAEEEKSLYELFFDIADFYDGEMEKNKDLIRKVLSYQDLENNLKEGSMSSVLTLEDGYILEGEIERLDRLYERGVRLLTLTWNHENCIGFPNSVNREDHMKGLKPFGIEVVEKINEKGMIADVSHLSEGGFYDVARHSTKPFVASHSCARALRDHPRNLTDDQLRCIAGHGGVAGVNFYAPFLKENSDSTFVSDIIRHVEYMVNKAGEDHVALGADLDGMDSKLEGGGYGCYGPVVRKLEEIFSPRVAEKICYKNALRVLKDCL